MRIDATGIRDRWKGKQSLPSAQRDGRIDRVQAGLFLGTYDAARQPELVRALNIARVVNVTAECPPPAGGPQQTLVVPVLDRDHARLLEHFGAICQFIDEGAASGGGTLVHCRYGISRSATAVLAYLMSQRMWRLSQAWEFLRERRPEIEPNPGFLAQLRTHELRLFGTLESVARLTVLDSLAADAGSADAGPAAAMQCIADRCATAPAAGLGPEMDGCALRLREESPGALAAALPSAACEIWRTHGGTSPGESQARQVFSGVWQRLVRASHPPLSAAETSLNRMEGSEEWADLLLDVPLAPAFLRELRRDLASSAA